MSFAEAVQILTEKKEEILEELLKYRHQITSYRKVVLSVQLDFLKWVLDVLDAVEEE